jgi:hypothetical protein
MRYIQCTWDVLGIFRGSGFIIFSGVGISEIVRTRHGEMGHAERARRSRYFREGSSALVVFLNYTGGTLTAAARQVGQYIIFLLPVSTQRAMQVEWKTVLHWHG